MAAVTTRRRQPPGVDSRETNPKLSKFDVEKRILTKLGIETSFFF